MNKLRLFSGLSIVFLTVTVSAKAQEWTQWRGPARDGLTPQHVVFLTNGADLIVAKRGTPAFTVERRYEVAEAATWAMPVLLGSNILVRDATGLMLLTAGK